MNQQIFQYLNNLAGQSIVFDTVIYFFAHYLAYCLALGLLLFFVFGKDKIRELKMIIFSLVSAFIARFVIAEIIRYFYYSPRPFLVLDNVYQLMAHSPTGSFPSGHAVFFFALATAVFFYHKKWGTLFFVGATLIGVSRVIAGVHWPLDIVAGALIGLFVTWLVYSARKIKI